MNILQQIFAVLTPVHRDGHKFIAFGAAITLLLFLLWAPLGWIAALTTACTAYFFRDPERVSPQREGLVLAPADGKILIIDRVVPPPELALGTEPLACVSIFLTMLDVHINRAPVSGNITALVRTAGVYHHANAPEARHENERQAFTIETSTGARFGVVQIAGYVARRTVSTVQPGDSVIAGDRIGLIRFGSRVDLYLPNGANILVAEGQRMIGGESVIADLSTDEPRRTFRQS